jgi:DNA helicase HerA-like ATPase
MGELNKADTSVPFLRLKARIEALGTDKRLGFIFPGHMVRDNLHEILSRLLRVPVSGKPLTLLDISGMPGEVVDVVISVICRMIFDYAVWSDRTRQAPVLLVCEEAHRYVPQAEGAGFEPTKRALGRIAKEGRKYGISLCLVTQRPSELSMSILSQCNTLFALRMSNERDHDFVKNALPESAQSFLSALPSLRTQEAIVMGEGRVGADARALRRARGSAPATQRLGRVLRCMAPPGRGSRDSAGRDDQALALSGQSHAGALAPPCVRSSTAARAAPPRHRSGRSSIRIPDARRPARRDHLPVRQPDLMYAAFAVIRAGARVNGEPQSDSGS